MDIGLVEFGWPLGIPLCRSLKSGLFEVRSQLQSGRIARVLFCVDRKQRMVLLHGFIKKTQETPAADLELARKNQRLHEAASGKNEGKNEERIE
jgi:phage-related protein